MNTVTKLRVCATCLCLCVFSYSSGTLAQSAEDPSNADGYYAELNVTAYGRWASDEEGEKKALAARVYVNGVQLGKTPFEEGLPEGTYLVEVRFGPELRYVEKLSVIPGRNYVVRADFDMPLTPEQMYIVAERKKQKELNAAKQKAEKKKTEKKKSRKKKVVKSEPEKELSAEDAALLKEAKIPYATAGAFTMVAGIGLLVGGGALKSVADDQEGYDKDRYDSSGTVLMVLGVVSLVAAVIVIAQMPKTLPTDSTKKESAKSTSFRVDPLVSDTFFGGQFSLTF